MTAMPESIEPEAETPSPDVFPTPLGISPGSTAEAMKYRFTSCSSEFQITHSMGPRPQASDVTVQICHGRRSNPSSVSHELMLGPDVSSNVDVPLGQAFAVIETVMETKWTKWPVETFIMQTAAVRVAGVEICGSISVKGKGKGTNVQ